MYVISFCLRVPRKIDSSIGLHSLNKVVTYSLTYFFHVECHGMILNVNRSAQLYNYNSGGSCAKMPISHLLSGHNFFTWLVLDL